MDDSAGESVGKYAAQFDQLGRPQQGSRQSIADGDATAAVVASVDNRKRRRAMDKDPDGGLQSLDAVVQGRGASLNECIDAIERRRSYSIDRRLMDAATVAFDQHASALAAGFVSDKTAQNLLPSRWWFASSVFPMVAATLGPVASAFSICALVRPWRQIILPGDTLDTAMFIKDPTWLTWVNAIQLFIALIANMFLLLNMARRVRFAVAQPITMTGWFFSSAALIALTATAANPLKDTDYSETELVWSQAFYYAIYAAVLYMAVASLMVVTFIGAWTGHYPKDFQLTNSQRTLMLQTIMFLMYLLLGALVFSHIEGWAYLDAVYWADVTLFTIGFGDFAAQTTLGRALLFPFALIGIISLGLVIGSIRSLALERGRNRLNARMTEKNRRKFLKTLARKGKDDILQPIKDQHESQDGVLDDRSSTYTGPRPNTTGLTEYERREEEFNIMRKIQHDAARKRRWLAMATSGGTWLALWLVGAWVFQVCENPYQGWNYFDGFYLAFVSLTTIGYGDMVPVSNAGRSFFVFWSLLALPATTILISNAGDTIVKAISDGTNALGRVTILPGEHGLKRELKELARALTCGVVFDDVDIEEAPPGLLGAGLPSPDDAEEAYAEEEEEEEEEANEAVDEVEKSREHIPYDDEENATEKGSSSMGGRTNNNGDDEDGASGSEQPTPGSLGDAHDGETLYREIADGDITGDAKHQSTASKDKSTPPPTLRRATTEYSQGSKKTTDSENGASIAALRRARTGDQMHSSRRSQTKSTQGASSTKSAKSSQYATSSASSSNALGYPLGSISAVSVPRLDLPQELPASRAEYHCVLIDEIAQVTQHLRHAPTRKYTFQEWAWFLKLIGEDEHNADLHRRALTRPPKKGRGKSGDKSGKHEHGGDAGPSETAGAAKNSLELNLDNEDPARLQWSWVGARSPLMGSQEEAEWILDKLTKRLQAELRTTRDAIVLYRKRRLELRGAEGDDGDRDRHGQLGREHHHSRTGDDDDYDEHADPSPYSRTAPLKRRETHPIEEEP